MPSTEKTVLAYEELADWYERQGLDQLRDRFLVLAADAALSGANAVDAERLRGRLLERNPHHLLKPYASLAEALKTADVQNYVSGLRRGYPPESVDSLLEGLRSGKPASGPSARPAPPPPAKPAPPRPEPAGEEEEQGTLRMPASQPLPLNRPPAKLAEPPAVYGMKDEKLPQTLDAPRPRQSPPPRSPAKPAAPAPAHPPAKAHQEPAAARPKPLAPKPARSDPVPRPVQPAAGYAVRPEPPGTAAGRTRDRDEQDDYPGAWVPSVLYALVLLAGVALAVYTFARPFLPAGWFR